MESRAKIAIRHVHSNENEETEHACALLCSLRELQDSNLVCDFSIKVNGEEFPTHRAVLVACSDYFRAMFKSDMKEVNDGYVIMKHVNPISVKQCIEFMYSGKANMNSENVHDLLYAADLMQLSKLTGKCFMHLEEALNVENCIQTSRMAQLFGDADLLKTASDFFKCQFTLIVSTNSFLELEVDDALKYIKDCGTNDEVKWKASKCWMLQSEEERKDHVTDFAKLLDFTDFPTTTFLESVWNDPYFKDTSHCMECLYQRVFRNVLDLGDSINIGNCFILKWMVDSYEHVVEEVPSILFSFMLKNFPAVTSNPKFITLQEKDVVALFQSPLALYISSEKIKWYAALRWVESNPLKRSNVFPILMQTIAINKLPIQFINNKVRKEELVQDFPQCQDMILDAILDRPMESQFKTYLAILDNNGSIDAFDISDKKWCPLHYTAKADNVRIVSLNGNLCVLDGKELHSAKDEKWSSNRVLMHRGICTSDQIVTLGDRIYVLQGNSVSYYDSLSGLWTVPTSIDFHLKMFYCAVSSDDQIFLIYSANFRDDNKESLLKYQSGTIIPVEVKTHLLVSITPETTGAFFNGKVYIYTKKIGQKPEYVMLCYDPGNKTWIDVPLPESSCARNRPTPHTDTSGLVKVPVDKLNSVKREVACLVATKDKLLLISTNSEKKMVIEGYDDTWNEWMKIQCILQANSQGKQKIVNDVCCFSTRK